MKTSITKVNTQSSDLSDLATQSQDMLKSHVSGYTRKDGAFVADHDDKRVAASKPPAIGAQHAALAASSDAGDLDHETNQVAARHMKSGDHDALKQHLQGADTAARDHVLDHIHPDHWEGLGYKPLRKEQSVADYDKKFGDKHVAKQDSPAMAASGEKKQPARTVVTPRMKREAEEKAEKQSADGPADGEIGSEEHKKYGKYFKSGDKVKDNYGKTHEVASHVGPAVHTKGGQSFHPTKLHRLDGAKPGSDQPMAKALFFVSPQNTDEMHSLVRPRT